MRNYIISILTFVFTALSTNLSYAEQSIEVDSLAPQEQQEPVVNARLSAKDLWKAAEQSYRDNRFTDAISAYNAILDQGFYSAKLYYNLGNAYFKADELGKSILYYRRALQLEPSDDDIVHNLEFARRKTKDKIEQVPEFFLVRGVKSLRSWMSADAWAISSLVLLSISSISLLMFLLVGRVGYRKVGFYTMCVSLLLFIVTTLFAWSARQATVEHHEAVVMSSAVSVKSSPDKDATELFVLHEGTEIVVGERSNDWVEVRIADGRKGWIEKSRIEEI